MKTVLVTGGTTFVSQYAAQYFIECGYDVYVLNRNTKEQVNGVKLIEADRHHLDNVLKGMNFHVVIDITAYNDLDIIDLYDALDSYDLYIMISSSAVYPETGYQPFKEDSKLAENKYWGKYGIDKIKAEHALLQRDPNAYIIRPPYLYGPLNNVYREAFVFDCALEDRPFYLPKDGEMKLQFYHVKDLCRFMNIIITNHPQEYIFNVGNKESISIKEWVKACYACLEKTPQFVYVYDDLEQRNYFGFYDYEYYLDVSKQQNIFPITIPLSKGLKESFDWYILHQNMVSKKPLIQFIDDNLIK